MKKCANVQKDILNESHYFVKNGFEKQKCN